jgi:hypothetical protein
MEAIRIMSKKCELSKEELIEKLYEYKKKYNKVPTIRDIRGNNLTPSVTVYLRVFKTTSWNAILEYAGMEINKPLYNYTKELLITKLRNYFDNLKRSPFIREISNPSSSVYYKVFKTQSWNKILKEAGLSYNHVTEYGKKEALIK